MRIVSVAFAAVLMAAIPPAVALTATPAAAQASVEDLTAAVVGIKTFINPDARTSETLGREREGSGVVIDDSGLVITIGYIMVEAYAAQIVTRAGRTVAADIVGYDHETGFGLLRATEPLKVRPMPLGKAAAVQEGDRVLVASFGGPDMLLAANVVSAREFTGSWEYLLERALFTAPPHPVWSGAALIGRDGKLVGIGSLIVSDAAGEPPRRPGNMFVPIDLLPPILADLIADGRSSGAAKPWLGVNPDDSTGRLIVGRVTGGSPAEKAGLGRGAVITAVNGEPVRTMAEFYRRVWALGSAGIVVPLDVEQDGIKRRIDITSMNRMDHLKLKSTF